MAIFLELFEVDTLKQRIELKGQVEIGRSHREEKLHGNDVRLVVAEHHHTSIPRRWFTLRQLGEDEVELENIHSVHAVALGVDENKVRPRDKCILRITDATKIVLSDGGKLSLRITNSSQSLNAAGLEDRDQIRSLELDRSVLTRIPGVPDNSPSTGIDGTILAMRTRAGSKETWEPGAVVALLEKALSVVTSAAGSDKFLEAAVQAAVEIVSLDRALIIGRQAFDKARAAYFTATEQTNYQESEDAELGAIESNLPTVDFSAVDSVDHSQPDAKRLVSHGWFPWVTALKEPITTGDLPGISLTVLQRASEHKKTQIFDAKSSSPDSCTQRMCSVVAAPIFDRNQELVAVFYGERWINVGVTRSDITDVEALLLEVFASAVAGGLARQVEEKSRAELSEFFSPRVASLLVQRRDLLAGRDAEVSVLFCDISGFSSISERFGARRTIQWINDVLTDLSECVVDRDGVLVDYVGDELFAMWGAPESQADHATRAVGAVMAMLDTVERLRSRAYEEFDSELDVRIGVNSGPARVGNVGSRLKFKYGVLGQTVNVGSRIQGACKHLGVRCLISGHAFQLLQGEFNARRIAKLRVVGIEETVDVYEVVRDENEAWLKLRDEYELALSQFEAGRPGETVHRLGKLLQQYPEDRPSMILLGKAAIQLTEPQRTAETVWCLDRK